MQKSDVEDICDPLQQKVSLDPSHMLLKWYKYYSGIKKWPLQVKWFYNAIYHIVSGQLIGISPNRTKTRVA